MGTARVLRLSLLLTLAISLVATSSASAEVVVGQVAPGTPAVTCEESAGFDEVQTAVSSGTSYVIPSSGVLTSWSTNAATGDGQSQGFKVFRPSGSNFLVVAEDAPRALTGGTINTFPVSIPVQAGDVIGLVYVGGTQTACALFTGSASDVFAFREGSVAPGGTFEPEATETEWRLNVSATVLPPPAISGISPASGSVKGASVVIAGSNFAHVSGVSFGSMPAAAITVDSEGQITATAPAVSAIASVPVTVTTAAGTATSPQPFTYEGCVVPKLVGKKLKAAKKKIRKADCKLGKIKKRGDATAKTGKIVKQKPKPGKLLAPGAKLSIVLGA